MRHKSRILSWLLTAAMVLSMVPLTAAAASPNIGINAGFTDDVTLRDGASGYEATLSVDLEGVAGFSGYGMKVDWAALKDYVKSVRYHVNDNARDKGRLDNYDGSRLEGLITDPNSQRYLLYYAADVVDDLNGVAIMDFSLESGIPAGHYPMDITLASLVNDEFEDAWDAENPDNYVVAGGTLTVKNADGSVPDGSEEAVFRISAEMGSSAEAGSVSFSKTEAKAGDTVTVFAKPNDGCEIVSVAVTAETDVPVAVSGGTGQVNGAYQYTFVMPESDVTVDAVFRTIGDSNEDEVAAGYILVKGTVLTSNNAPLAGAAVRLTYNDGSYKNQVAKEAVTGKDGSFVLEAVSGSYSYTLQAICDTGIQQGKPADPGYLVYSNTRNISLSSSNVDGKGEISTQTLTVALYYEWDVDGDNTVETVYAGKDDKFLTSDDFYQATVGGRTVNVYADVNGSIQSEKGYYLWEVDADGVKEKVYVGGGFKSGTTNDWYPVDVDHDPKTADVPVTIGEDCTPATVDDRFTLDVNNDGKAEIVYAGSDGLIATADDWYLSDGKTAFSGEDEIAGTADDWYLGDGDGHGGDETIFVGKDRLPHTADDFYLRDVDGDGKNETIYAGEDARFNTSDDHYEAEVGGETVKVYPGANDSGTDPYEFGRENDHYGYTVGGQSVDVRVGKDRTAGTEDDYYEYDVDGDGTPEHVRAGKDRIPGTKDDEYDHDIDKDGAKEVIYAGEDAKPGTGDDWYYPIITFNAGAGTVNGSGTWSLISSSIRSLPSASRSGYQFNGWSRTQGGSVMVLDQVLALRADTTLYASYSFISSGGGSKPSQPSGGGSSGGGGGGSITIKPTGSNMVTFESNGGSTVQSQSVKAGGKAVKPADPTRKDFNFTGWYTDENCTKAFDFNTKISKATTLYAGWKFSGSDTVFQNLVRDHVAYITGYDDGLVHPGSSMTRAQVAQMFYNLLTNDAKAKYNSTGSSFTDVASEAWYNKAVSTLANMGILSGYGDGRFGPDDAITRAQFAAICVRLAGLNTGGSNGFKDVPKSHWAYGCISAAVNAGWISGYGNGSFGPDDALARAQAVSLMNRMLGRSNINSSSFAGLKSNAGFRAWPDNTDTSKWYYNDLIEAGNGHNYKSSANGIETWTSLKAAK